MKWLASRNCSFFDSCPHSNMMVIKIVSNFSALLSNLGILSWTETGTV